MSVTLDTTPAQERRIAEAMRSRYDDLQDNGDDQDVVRIAVLRMLSWDTADHEAHGEFNKQIGQLIREKQADLGLIDPKNNRPPSGEGAQP